MVLPANASKRAEARGGTFFFHQERRVDRARRVIQGHDQIEHRLPRKPLMPRPVLVQQRNAAGCLRQLQTRLLKAEAGFINALVDYYYFLLALRVEHDPDARGGPSFDNAEDLAAYLREQLEA